MRRKKRTRIIPTYPYVFDNDEDRTPLSITTTGGAITIALPFPKFSPDDRFILILFFVFWSAAGMLGMTKLIQHFRGEFYPDLLQLVIWLSLWIVSEIGICYILLQHRIAKEVLDLSPKTLTIRTTILGVGRKQQYELEYIKQLIRVPPTHDNHAPLQFEYAGETVMFGKHLDTTTSTQLFQILTEIRAFHCHVVECIVFGTPYLTGDDTQRILQNPDVSTLQFPFVRLQHIVIHLKTADFHQVERFLTYAINSIGQDYLKNTVDVHIYGNPEQFHTNLLNSFKNFCRMVHVHPHETNASVSTGMERTGKTLAK